MSVLKSRLKVAMYMKLFSQRHGLKPLRAEVQVNNLDADLRIRLWNVLTKYYWEEVHSGYDDTTSHDPQLRLYLERLWHDYFKQLLDTMPFQWNSAYQTLRKRFFNSEWNEVYDFIEFTAAFYPTPTRNEEFRLACNQ